MAISSRGVRSIPSHGIIESTQAGRIWIDHMSTISVSLPTDGTAADVADYNTPITTIVNAINGGLDNTNIATGAAIATSKLADDAGITTAKVANGSITPNKLDLDPSQTQRNTSSTTTSTSFTSTLADGLTDSVTVTVGANGLALVSIFGILSNSGNNYSTMAFAISGATTRAASDFRNIGNTITNVLQFGATFLETGLTPGSTTFTIQYRVGAGTGTFNGRCITVVPL